MTVRGPGAEAGAAREVDGARDVPDASDVPDAPDVRAAREHRAAPRDRSWLEVRWRQLRNAPRPVWRAVAANAIVAAVGGVALLAYDVALDRGASLPGGDLRTLAIVVFVALVVIVGSAATYLWVPLPSGAGGRRRRTPWSAMLGLFASLPVAYLVLVLLFQVLRPLLG